MIGSSDGLSSIFGWISIACWIVVYSPQVYENYALQSGEGLSVLFVLVWLVGDLCNLLGAVIAGLLPTIIILACYYSLCDSTLLCQIYYYRWKHGHPLFKAKPMEGGETAPLLPSGEQEDHKLLSTKALVIRYTSALLFVCIVGTTAWWIAGKEEEKTPRPDIPSGDWWKSQVLGWTSAVLFIGSRVPQIMKNVTTRCEGLSPALFFFAVCGNITCTLSIVAKSSDWGYLLTNASWIAGSSLIVFLDIFVSG
ncbi:PQ-loop-domain-containing protein [Macrolepiota fuliginosa MF-IS2]|uniref:PQ-loop-domain-containing protein n=1 Tax=Macrolepiota fuliginosa MF-IS2 TaxID=1400762 RepID=A0A9P5XNJ7_9AGAR|nr:PQ-loop-domain-containing protein [Macrolepiota fuliginosa MF-IS2]